MCQNLREMWIGPLAPLNVETGANVMINQPCGASIFYRHIQLVSVAERNFHLLHCYG